MTAAIPWACLTPGCPEHGTTTGTDAGADAKHVKTSGHATTTALTVEAAARMGECANPAQNKGYRPTNRTFERVESGAISGPASARTDRGQEPTNKESIHG